MISIIPGEIGGVNNEGVGGHIIGRNQLYFDHLTLDS